jgi:hypothetical protein
MHLRNSYARFFISEPAGLSSSSARMAVGAANIALTDFSRQLFCRMSHEPANSLATATNRFSMIELENLNVGFSAVYAWMCSQPHFLRSSSLRMPCDTPCISRKKYPWPNP